MEVDKEVLATVRANQPPRYKRLEALESWVNGSQYDRKKSWWDDSVPLWERAPCIVYQIVSNAIQSNVDLVLGEGRFPELTSKPGEDEADEENGLSSDQSADLDRFIDEYHKLCRFPSHCREAFSAAQGSGGAVAIHGWRNGIPFADLIPSKWGTPEFDAYGNCISLKIQYPFVEEFQKPNGEWSSKCKLYKRVIDTTKDTTFETVDARPDGREPTSWPADAERSVTHGLGFCPVVWYPFMKGCAPVNQIDGLAIHARLTDEIQAHDIAISQRHRCALMSEPQIIEVGVTPGENPTDTARKPRMISVDDNGRPVGSYDDSGPQQAARKKGPSYVWQYPNPETKVSTLTIGADALKAQDDNARDLRIKLQESLAVVTLDPENIKFAATTSGKALAAIKQRQLDRCDQYRDDLKDAFLLPSVQMQLRIAAKVGKQLNVPGIDKVTALLKKFASGKEWQAPSLVVEWGPYFPADADDQTKIVALVQAARGAPNGEKLITKEIAVRKMAEIFDIDNPDAILEELEKEQTENDAAELEKTTAEQKSLHAITGPKPPGAPGSGSGGFGGNGSSPKGKS